jgi:hypothetical protein
LPAVQRLFIGVILLLTLAFSVRQDALPALSAARPVIDTDNPVYSHLQNRILISGAGFQAFSVYHLWLKKPNEGNTSYTGVFFVATGTGSVPYPDVSIILGVQPILGTYLLTASVSSDIDTGEATCHFGIVGTLRAVYQRRETARYVGGGALPGSTVRIDIRNPLGTLVRNATMIANELGEFENTWSIPNNVQVGSWSCTIGGTGTLDNSLERYYAEGQFGVIEASLKISIQQKPLEKYQRTQSVKVAFMIKYPDDSPVATIKQGSKPVDIYRANMRTNSLPLILSDPVNGIWVAEYAIPRNETLIANVTLSLSVNSFDDGFGNKAPLTPWISSQFEISPAQLAVSVSTLKTTYQVLFDSVTLNITTKYPSGADLVDGKVSVTFETGNWKDQRLLLLSEKSHSGIMTYYLPIFELRHLGTWKITASAEDSDGNKGISTIEVGVGMLWLFVTAVTLSVLVMVIAKWMREEPGLRRVLRIGYVKKKNL